MKVVPLRCVYCRVLLAVRQNKEHKQAELQISVHSSPELEDDFDVTYHATYGIRRCSAGFLVAKTPSDAPGRLVRGNGHDGDVWGAFFVELCRERSMFGRGDRRKRL